ncbi:hypothetical protein Bca101_009880 [Brassica carinata]
MWFRSVRWCVFGYKYGVFLRFEVRQVFSIVEASKQHSKHRASGGELMDQVTGRSRWITMEQVKESVKSEIAKSIATVRALTREAIGFRTWFVLSKFL